MIEAVPAGLDETQFRLTCESGFGDGWNHYAHSMAWFRGQIFVGTSRGTMAALRHGYPPPNLKPWPIEAPEDLYDVDRRAEIWAYQPQSQEWIRVYQAEHVLGSNGRSDVPRYISFRSMCVLQAPGDREPCLYASAWAPHTADSPDILRSEDGRVFAPIPRPPFGPAVRACRTLQPFDGRLHISPTASGSAKGFLQDISSEAVIYASADPSRGEWTAVNDEGFGNPDNVTVFEMVEFDGHLYGGTVNAVTGGEVWRAPKGKPPYQWQPVVVKGAGRGKLNEVAGTLCEFNGDLYVAYGIINGGYHRAENIGPAAAEIIRLRKDGSWDLIVGESRTTEQGLKYPLSGFGPGFDSMFNGYIWRMCVHDGWLYAGTLNWADTMPYLAVNLWPEDVLSIVRRWGEENLLARYGGAELWRTADGIHWKPVTRSGFGNKYNWGIRTLQSTPHGLFVGTVNPYGPKVAVKRGKRWSYVYNPRGGCEVWLGSSTHD